MADSFSESDLAKLVANHTGADPDALSLQPSSTGKYNATYFVSGAERPLVLRIAPEDDPALHLFYEYRMMRQEPGLHSILRQKTAAPVPEVLASGRMHPALGRDYLLMERLPGWPISDHSTLAGAARIFGEVGDALRQVHAITRDTYGYVGEHAPMEPQSRWPDAFHIMWNRILDDIERCGGYSAEEAGYMRGLLDRHMPAFDRPVASSLLHMDVWAQNILAGDAGELTGLLDWDRALWGDPEIEFAVLDYCGISEPAFWEGYGGERDDSAQARVRRLFYFLYELQKYIFIRRVRGGSASTGDQYRAQALQIAESLA